MGGRRRVEVRFVFFSLPSPSDLPWLLPPLNLPPREDLTNDLRPTLGSGRRDADVSEVDESFCSMLSHVV